MFGRSGLLALPLLLLAACDAQPDEPPLDHVEIRVVNGTDALVESLDVELQALDRDDPSASVSETRSFGPLRVGEATPYLAFEGAPEYTLLTVSARGGERTQTYTTQRDDPDVFDPFIGPGRYALRIAGEYFPTTYLASATFRLDGPADDIQVRLENRTARAFDAATVWFRGPEPGVAEEVAYGALAPGAVSGYAVVPHSYPYAPYRVVSDGDTLRYAVTDYDGVDPVPPGRYTYALVEERGVGFRDQSVLVREGDR